MIEIKHIYTLVLAVFLTSSLNAQTDTLRSADLPTDQVEVIKNFRASTLNTKAIFRSPVVEDIPRENHLFIYDFTIPKVDFKAPEPKLRPLAYDEPLIKELNDGFIDLSFGSPSFPKLEAGYHYNIEDWFELGFTGTYYTIDDSEIEFRDVNHSDINVYGAFHLSKSLTLKGGLDYFLEDKYFYALPSSLLPDVQDSLNRSFNRFMFNGGLQYVQDKEKGLVSELTFKYWQTDIDNFGLNEDLFEFDFSLDKVINPNSVFSLVSNYRIYSSDEEAFDVSSDFSYINITPQLRVDTDERDVLISVGLNKLADSSFVFNPTVVIDQEINESFNLELAYSSLFTVQDANYIYQKNQFNAFVFYEYDAYQLDQIFLNPVYSFNGNKANLKIAYNFEDNALINEAFQDPSMPQFSRLESDKYLSLSPSVQFNSLPVFINLDGNYRFRQDSKYLLPNWDLKLCIQKSLAEDKLNLELSYLMMDDYNLLLNTNPELAKRNEILQSLSASVRYKLLDKLSLYVNADNITGQQYEFVNNYLNYGFQLRGGLFLTF